MAEEQTALQPKKEGPLNVSLIGGVVPKNYAELMQFSALVHNSGLAPKSLDTLPKVAVAMMMAYEIGLPLFTGIQNIAVINGKAALWGDAIMAVVHASGQMEEGYPVEWVEGTPFQDNWTFFCKVKRRGRAESVGTFSWAEAKRAGFDNPQMRGGGKDIYSPWTRFPRRMMQWKARQWVYRDQFGDVLRGMRMAEEAFDTIDMEQHPNGGYEAPERVETMENQAQGVQEIFTSVMGERTEADVSGFVAHCAKQFGVSEEQVMTSALEDPDNFINAFDGWAKPKEEGPPPPPKQERPKEKKPEGPPPPPPAPQAQTEGEPEPEPEEDFRSQWINLRGPGFSTYVWKNAALFQVADEDTLKEARDKWRKLYRESPIPPHLGHDESTHQEPEGDGVGLPPYNDRDGFLQAMDEFRRRNSGVFTRVLAAKTIKGPGEPYWRAAEDVPEGHMDAVFYAMVEAFKSLN